MKIILTTKQFKRIITESTRDELRRIYLDIVRSVKHLGTNFSSFFSALQKLQNWEDFNTIQFYFLDRKTGYNSFEEMVDNEFDFSDLKQIKKIEQILSNIGVSCSYNVGKKLGVQTFAKGFNTNFGPSPNIIKENYQQFLTSGKKYWEDWLQNPITIKKMAKNKKNYDISKTQNKVKKYIEILNKTSLVFYADSQQDVFAYIICNQPYKVFVNLCMDDSDGYGTILHELQHLLNCYEPINPLIKISKSFVGPNTTKLNKITYDNSWTQNVETLPIPGFTSMKNYTDHFFVNRLANNLNLNYEQTQSVISSWLENLKWNKEHNREQYQCDPNEKMSNLASVRKELGLRPGQNITLQVIKPYITGELNHTDIYWLLSCWAYQGFNDINKFLNELNSLAKNDQKTLQNTGKV